MTIVHPSAEDVREAIADALESIPGIQVSPYLLSNPTPPSALVMRGLVHYDQAMGSAVNMWEFTIRVFVADVADIGAATVLDSFLSVDGSHSIKAAVEADLTLGGIVQSVHVTEASGEQVFVRDSGGPLLGSEWTVEVWL